jgi:chorismate-pyruvate lyase
MPDPLELTAADSAAHRAELADLVARLGYSLPEIGGFEPVAASVLPLEYQILLVHHDHMTVAVEAFHDSHVDVRVLQTALAENRYTRSSLLTRRDTGARLQFGVVSIRLEALPAAVREAFIDRAVPLGRALIRHNVLREVELRALWRIMPGPRLQTELGVPAGTPIFGRTAAITVNNQPAVEVLEIVRLVSGP